MAQFTIDCVYCPPGSTLMSVSLPKEADDTAWREAWKATTTAGPGGSSLYLIECVCGARFTLEDDGLDASLGGLVTSSNVTQPRIDSLNISAGPRLGGNALFLLGGALENGALVVKFDGKPAILVDTVTEGSARAVVPPASYRLNAEEYLYAFSLTVYSGSLSAGEAVTTADGSTGIVRYVGSTFMIALQSRVGTIESMVGTIMTGAGGGAATIDAITLPTFLPGEGVTGLTSGTGAVLRTNLPIVVDTPSGAFAVNELVKGDASGAMVRLTASPAYSGIVDVSVENENGQRVVGGLLPGAYTYA